MSLAAIDGIASLASNVLDRFFPNKSEQEKQEIAMAVMVIQGQIETNKVEAANPNMFVAGWRPFVGWVCGTGFAVQFVIAPIAEWLAALTGHPVKFPELDMDTLLTLLGGMLGLGGLRTFEKLKGANRRH